jgi:hypothetical protein
MNSLQYIPSFYFNRFAQAISEPYTNTQAYRSGVIDASGNVMKPESSIDPFEYFVIKLKKIFDELPSGMTKAQLNNYLTTMKLFSESIEYFGVTKDEYIGLMEGYLAQAGYPEASLVELNEDMGAGGMAVAGSSPGYNTGGVSGYDPPMGKTQKRVEPVLKGLDACDIFDVCPEELKSFQSATKWGDLEDGENTRYLRRYALRNPNKKLAVRSVDPDTGKSTVHWLNFKPTRLKEEFMDDCASLLEDTERQILSTILSKKLDKVQKTGADAAVKKGDKLDKGQVEAVVGLEGLISSAADFKSASDKVRAKFLDLAAKTSEKGGVSDTKPIDAVFLKGGEVFGTDVKMGTATNPIRLDTLDLTPPEEASPERFWKAKREHEAIKRDIGTRTATRAETEKLAELEAQKKTIRDAGKRWASIPEVQQQMRTGLGAAVLEKGLPITLAIPGTTRNFGGLQRHVIGAKHIAGHIQKEPARLAYGREGEELKGGVKRHEPQVVSRELARSGRGFDRLAANVGKNNMALLGRTDEDESAWPDLFGEEPLARLYKILRGEN